MLALHLQNRKSSCRQYKTPAAESGHWSHHRTAPTLFWGGPLQLIFCTAFGCQRSDMGPEVIQPSFQRPRAQHEMTWRDVTWQHTHIYIYTYYRFTLPYVTIWMCTLLMFSLFLHTYIYIYIYIYYINYILHICSIRKCIHWHTYIRMCFCDLCLCCDILLYYS